MENWILYALLGLAVVTLIFTLYNAGKDAQKAVDAANALNEQNIRNKEINEIKEKSHEDSMAASNAGDVAGPAPLDPDQLPPEVRARILGPR